MREKYKYIISYVSLLLNAIYLGIWIYSFEKYEAHEERVVFFEKFIPFRNLDFFLLVFSIFSIIVFARSNSVIHKVFLVFQIGFALLFFWQFL